MLAPGRDDIIINDPFSAVSFVGPIGDSIYVALVHETRSAKGHRAGQDPGSLDSHRRDAFNLACRRPERYEAVIFQIDSPRWAAEADNLLARFPNAAVHSEERRRLRAGLYSAVLELDNDARARVVEVAMAYLVPEDEA